MKFDGGAQCISAYTLYLKKHFYASLPLISWVFMVLLEAIAIELSDLLLGKGE